MNKDNNNKNEVLLLNNQLGLKEDEINRLNKDIEEYLMKIKELTCENNLLRNNYKMKANNNILNSDNNNNKKHPKDTIRNDNNKINNIEEINTKYKNINNFIKNKNYQENNDENDNNSDCLSEKVLENDLAKNQDDIDKINAQLRELSQLENESNKK